MINFVAKLTNMLHNTPFVFRYLYPKSVVWDIKNSNNSIYLTFDDGPNQQVTPKVLDILEKYNIKATFFMVGNNVQNNLSLFNDIVDLNHSVGGHTYNHVKATKVSYMQYKNEIDEVSKMINSKLFRPPHGILPLMWAKKISAEYKIVMWSVISGDFSPKLTPQQCLDVTNKYTKSGSIIVFHDSIKAAPNMLEILEDYIEHCLDKGYSFEKIPQSI